MPKSDASSSPIVSSPLLLLPTTPYTSEGDSSGLIVSVLMRHSVKSGASQGWTRRQPRVMLEGGMEVVVQFQ